MMNSMTHTVQCDEHYSDTELSPGHEDYGPRPVATSANRMPGQYRPQMRGYLTTEAKLATLLRHKSTDQPFEQRQDFLKDFLNVGFLEI